MMFPELSRYDRFAVDTETTGTSSRDVPVGMSLSTPDGKDYYFAWGHQRGGNNCDLSDVVRWARRELSRPGQTCVMHNAPFDLRMLAYVGIDVGARVEDTNAVAALLNEHEPSFALDSLALKYTGEGKTDEYLYDWCAKAFGGRATRNQQAGNIWRAPGDVVAPYAMGDTRSTLRLYDMLRPRIDEEGLARIYEVETAQYPVLLKMHLTGVRIDLQRAEGTRAELSARLDALRAQWTQQTGGVNYNSTAQLAALFDQLGLEYARTERGNPSITKAVLEATQHPVADMIMSIRRLEKMIEFVGKIMAATSEYGLIHGEFHPLRNDTYGTISGRYSSGGELNLQNIPARDEEIAPLIRSLMIPYHEDLQWLKMDYSQIEYRFFAHYAGGRVRQAYVDDPRTDFHQLVSDLTGIIRDRAKNVNFAKLYGAGIPRLAATMGATEAEAAELVREYEERIPEAQILSDKAIRRAERRGYIVTWGGRKCRFRKNPFYLQERVSRRGNKYIDRNFYDKTYAALNRLLQGSAADLLKMSMVRADEVIDWSNSYTHLTVHDEIDASIPKGAEGDRIIRDLKERFEDYDLTVPIVADAEVGPNWGHVQEWNND